VEKAPQVLARDVFRGDEMEALVLHELVHPADIPVADFAGDFQLILEARQSAFVQGDFGLKWS